MRPSHIAIIVALVIAGFLAMSSIFTVHQAKQALVLQFGNVKRLVVEPGLHFKIPMVQDIVYFDKRVLDFDAPATEVPTRDQKQLVVDAFARYRIIDPLRFFQTVRDENGMEARLGNVINANLRATFGEVELVTLMTADRARLIKVIADLVRAQSSQFGIDVIGVRIKRIDLPDENKQAVERRMQTQREQEARKIRAEGEKESKRIRAEADKSVTIIEAHAQRTGDILRGEGEAEAQATYNDAYGRDQEFFDFWVSMKAMREGLSGATTRYVGPPDGDFFRFFGDVTGGADALTNE